jgi:hypothetical protein
MRQDQDLIGEPHRGINPQVGDGWEQECGEHGAFLAQCADIALSCWAPSLTVPLWQWALAG